MWDESRFRDQVKRVRSSSWVLNMTETDPVVVEAYNEELAERHEVIPESIDCSCELQGDTGSFCDHIVALVDAEGYAGALMREYLKEKKHGIEEQRSKSEHENVEIEEKYDKIMSLLNAIDIDDFSLVRTRVDATSMLKSISSDQEGTIERAPTPEDNREAFEEMVKQVRIEERKELDLPIER